MRERKLLLIGPFPPPIGGDTVLTEDLKRSSQWTKNGIDLITVNTSHRGGVRLPDTRISPSDMIRAGRIIIQILIRLPRTEAVLFWANRRFLCTAGTVIIHLCNLFGRPVLAKAFGGSLAKRIKRMRGRRRKLVVGALKKCRYILPETGRLARELVDDIGIPPSQVRMMPNFLSERFFNDPDPGPVDGSFDGKCLFLGQIKREKGVFTIIRALKSQAAYSCDFFGPIVERDREEFTGQMAESSNMEYRGIASPGEVPSILGKYDVLLLPTRHKGEGYPAVILQAFAMGVPVIASDWICIPDLIGDNQRGILIPVKKPEALLAALDRLSSDFEFREAVRDNARDYARMYSEEKIIGDILISGLLGKR